MAGGGVRLMELSHLRYFFHVATARSFVQGARAACVTPPALSKAIRTLEEELGIALLERTTRHVRLTRAGELALDRCRHILEEVESMRRETAAAAGEVKGDLRIGAMEVFSIELLPAAITCLVRRHPGVVPLVHEMGPEDMMQALERGLLDVGFSIGGQPTAGVHRDVLGLSPAVVVCGRGHPLHGARSKPPRLDELANHPWVVPRFLGKASFPALDQFPDDRWPRRVGATIELLQAGIQLASGGAYLGCFPEISIRRELASGRLRRVRRATGIPPFELALFTRRKTVPSPSIEALVRMMRDVLSKRAPEQLRRS
jgi:DNA-binding transcriptional LysR family regulator